MTQGLLNKTASSKHNKPTAQPHVSVDGRFLARGSQRIRLRGVTYGPFEENSDGYPFPTLRKVRDDFARIAEAGFNAIRTYHVPPLGVLIDVPWSKHICFLDSRASQREARQAVQKAAGLGRNFSCVLGYSICNEIAPDIIRWHGARRIEKFVSELMDVTKQGDPLGLVTFANYPSAEYLDLSFLDFITFNVYLHDRETFRRYLCRLQNLVGDKPLVLGELGMDTLRHGENLQADFLAGHLREAALRGLAGAFIFSWTDEWHTGNFTIRDWAFGITNADRSPKASLHAVRELNEQPLPDLLSARPRVSVVVCSYNGGRTLAECLRSLRAVNYPDYEVIVVDDGSTDDTRHIVGTFPWVRAIHQTNQGLSVARNVGLQAATGSIIAYTDSDCFVDADWLTYIVAELEHSGAAAVGGPNLSPEDGWLAACVAASPGQPTHVLESDQEAEHIPGCNMAFRREALELLNGFDPQYHKAGDDVDICWRLQQAGMWITFAPGAFVWHHRRQGPRAYLRQQAGYGEAEALLRFKHPDKFNGRGDGKWRGVMYGAALQGLRFGTPIIYSGIFATGFFQCIYQPGPAHWAMLPTTLEWHFVMATVLVLGVFSPLAWAAAGAMFVCSLVAAGIQAAQARVPRCHQGMKSRLVVFLLSYAQPLVRSWHRYRTRLLSAHTSRVEGAIDGGRSPRLPLRGRRTLTFWANNGRDRTEVLAGAIAHLAKSRWGNMVASGWSNWDLEIDAYSGTVIQVHTVQENHGGDKRLIRVHFRLRPRPFVTPICSALVAVSVASMTVSIWTFPLALFLISFLSICWWRATALGGRIVGMFQRVAGELGLTQCGQRKLSSESGSAEIVPAEIEQIQAVNQSV